MVAASGFDAEVDGFIGLVIERLIATGMDASPLQALWADVLAERHDPEVSSWRQMEARLGYDAGEAPDWLMTRLDSLAQMVGRAALDEIAPSVGVDMPEHRLKRITDLADTPGVPAKVEIAVTIDDWLADEPWLRGRKLAEAARRRSSLAAGPVSDKDLTNLLGLSVRSFGRLAEAPPIGLGVREPGSRNLMLHFRRRNQPGRRFEAARFLADQLTAPDDDRWLPQTDTATVRQKMQRAFAAEFLMPIDDLRDYLGVNVTSEAIEEAADRYGVSALAVSSHLANHQLIPLADVLAG